MRKNSLLTSFLEPVLASAGLSDLQVAALMALYLTGTSAPHTAWIIIGIGLRCAQDIGEVLRSPIPLEPLFMGFTQVLIANKYAADREEGAACSHTVAGL